MHSLLVYDMFTGSRKCCDDFSYMRCDILVALGKNTLSARLHEGECAEALSTLVEALSTRVEDTIEKEFIVFTNQSLIRFFYKACLSSSLMYMGSK